MGESLLAEILWGTTMTSRWRADSDNIDAHASFRR